MRKGVARNTEVVRVTRSQNKNLTNVTSKAQRVTDAAKRVGDAIKRKVLGDEYAPVTEGVSFLKREKEKKKSKSKYLTQRDAGKLAKRKMAKKDQEKVNFLEP